MSDPSPSKRELILERLAALLTSPAAAGFFPEPTIDAPEPKDWRDLPETGLHDAVNVADGPVESLAFANGADEPSENELEAAIAYVVAGLSPRERRSRRDQGMRLIVALVSADPTLGLGVEVYAEVQEPTRDDNVPIPHAKPVATVVAPIKVLYSGADKAD